MRSWVERALAEIEPSENAFQKGSKGTRADSSALRMAAKGGRVPDFVSFGSESALASTDVEWRITGCRRFVALAADWADAGEERFGCCLSCGASVELHGSPAVSDWRRVDSLEDVELVKVRFVLASAEAIVREARR